MRTSSEFRAEARNSLANKWGKAVLFTLIQLGVIFGINLILGFIPVLNLLGIVVTIPLSYGLISCFMKLKRTGDCAYGDFFTDSFSNFGKIWAVVGQTILKLIVPILIVAATFIIYILGFVFMGIAASTDSDASVIFGIIGVLLFILFIVAYAGAFVFLFIKALAYSLVPYILFDNPNMTAKEMVELSDSMMKNQKWNYFKLQLSFIGWFILTYFTCGIGTLFLTPYMNFATIAFYEDRANDGSNM